DLSNLALLCRRHHTLVHEGGWSFDYDPADDSVSVRHPNGFPMATSPPSRPVDGDIEAQNSSAGADIDAYTCVSDGAGERMDYSMAVEGWLVLNGYPLE
ncbi:MAG: hypothetical protein ACRDX8_09625, partial [Acidimicrobiales bacterium]